MKKASLQLSINAVVILVLAIAMLGLGLGFTKKMFARFGDTLVIPEPDMTATESDPIVTIGDTLNVKIGKTYSTPVKYFHVGGAATAIYAHIECPNKDDFSYLQPQADGESKTYRLFLTVDLLDDGAGGYLESAICTIRMCEMVGAGQDECSPSIPGGDDALLGAKQISLIKTG